MSSVHRQMAHARHLVRRLLGSLSTQPPAALDDTWALQQLTSAEADWWMQMSAVDRRHAIHVARRFLERRPQATRAELAGALLHDVGKVDADLGTMGRVIATLVGPRTDRFRRYHDHERIGAEMLRAAGSDPVTIGLVGGSGDAANDLHAADEI